MVKMVKLDPADAVPGWRVVLPNGRTVIVEGRFGVEVRHTSSPVPMLVFYEVVQGLAMPGMGVESTRVRSDVMTFGIGAGMHWSFHEDLRSPIE